MSDKPIREWKNVVEIASNSIPFCQMFDDSPLHLIEAAPALARIKELEAENERLKKQLTKAKEQRNTIMTEWDTSISAAPGEDEEYIRKFDAEIEGIE